MPTEMTRITSLKRIAFMLSSCPALHSGFIIAFVYQHSGACAMSAAF